MHLELTLKGTGRCGLYPAQHISTCMNLNLQPCSPLEEEVKGFVHYVKLQ